MSLLRREQWRRPRRERQVAGLVQDGVARPRVGLRELRRRVPRLLLPQGQRTLRLVADGHTSAAAAGVLKKK